MAKQTSRMYGIKVKERVNYYEFGANDGFITLFYLSDVGSGAWQIKAGKHDGTNPADDVEWWMNGVKYNAGDVIHSWNDGDIVTFHILESHTGTTPYTNYMYDIFGNAAENIEYGNKDVTYRIVPSTKSQYACKVYKLENGIIVSTKEFTSEDIRNYKETYSQIQNNPLYPVYNMLFDWHGADPHSGYPQMSFQAISNSNYIKYNGNTIGVNETIKTWQAIGFLGFEVTDDSDKYTAKKKGVDALPSIQLVKRIGGANIATANKDKSNIFSDVYHDHKEVYYNGNYHKAMYLVYDNVGVQDCWRKTIGSLALTYAYPYWFLMAIKAGVEYAGTTYEARKLIRSWKPSDTVNMTLRERISKRKSDSKETNKIVYDITKTANVDSITVIMQEIDANRQYTDLDTITFTSSDSPVTFHNLQYKFESTKWTIISKCGYIKYNGNTYPNNRRILSFNLDEDVHIEITDETNKYLVETEITYTVKTPNSDVQALYSVHTSETAKTLKLVKSISDKEEPWVTVYFYDAMYKPVEYDDISVRFDNTNMEWELYSNNDNLYFNGTNYSKGSLLSSWSYDTIAKIGNIVVTHENHDAIEVVELEKSNTKSITNTDVDEDIAWHNADSIDFHISYSFAKGVWTIKAVKDCWMDGIHLFNGDIIKQFKTKTFVDPFSFLFAYRDDEESPVITNIVYTVEATVGFDGVTNVSVSSSGHPSKSFTDKDISNGSEKTLIFTKQDARSMYGYIWQKEETPPPPVWVHFYLLYTVFSWGSGTYNQYGSLRFIDDRDLSHIKNKKQLQISGYRWNPYAIIKYNYSFLNRIFVMYSYYSNRQDLMICDNITDTNPVWDWLAVDVDNFSLSFVKNRSTFVGRSRLDCNIYYEYTVFEDHTIRKTLEKDISELPISSGFHYDCTNSCNLFVRPFGLDNKVIYIADLDHSDYTSNYALYIYEPYNDRMTEYGSVSSIPAISDYTRDHTITTYNRYNILPEDLGKRNKYCYFHIGPSGGMSNYIRIKDEFGNYDNIYRYDQYKEFLDGNTFYAFGEITIETWEVYSYSVGSRIYYDDRRIDVDHNYVRIELTPSGSSIEIIDPTDYNRFPCIYEGYEYIPETCFLFFTGTYEFNGDKYFIGLKYNKINDPSYAVYDIGNVYGIFKFNKETKLIDKVREINGENPIYINRIDISTGEIVGTEEFYWKYDYDSSKNHIFYHTTMDGGSAGGTNFYSDNTVCRAFVGALESYINVSAIPSDLHDKVIISVGKSNKRIYVVFDNPTFSPSVGNYCFYEDSHDY